MGALLSFDLRKSSELATLISPRDMYLIIHTYLPTTIAVIKEMKGIIVGLRGDGAIAIFGLVEQGDGKPSVIGDQAETAVSTACKCGDAIVKAVQLVVNPALAAENIQRGKEKVGKGRGALQVGVGIDVGNIVATRIGLGEANELTAYGIAVNQCCKLSFGNDEVILTKAARDMFPESKHGRTGFNAHPTKNDAYILRYPPEFKTVA